MYQAPFVTDIPDTFPQPGDTISTPLGTLNLFRLIGRGKSGYSYQGQLGSRTVVYKHMHTEPCAYYSFSEAKTQREEQDYHLLREMDIPVPRLLHVDHENAFLIKDYIDGQTAAESVSEGLPGHEIMKQLFAIASRCRSANRNIDFFPTNFVIDRQRLYYVDYETNPYEEQWSLEQWGLYFWGNPAGMQTFLRSGSTALLHSKADKGIPLKHPLTSLIQEWIAEYRN